MIKYIGDNKVASINLKNNEIKKLYIGDKLEYWNLETKPTEKGIGVTDFNFNFNIKQLQQTPIGSLIATVPNDENANWKEDLKLKGGQVRYNHVEGYLILDSQYHVYGEYLFNSTSENPFNRTDSNPNMTIIYKVGRTTDTATDLISNRGDNYNWMLRPYSTDSKIHYQGETASVPYEQNVPKILVLTNNNGLTTHRVIGGESVTSSDTAYGNQSNAIRFFRGYLSTEKFYGEVYWMFQANRVLSEEEIQKVIRYNENL